MENALRMSLLLDFYGELLTPRQRQIFDLYYNEDLSLGEIAINEGITRQAVRDCISKGCAALETLEDTMGVMKSRVKVLACADRLEKIARDNPASAELFEICKCMRGDFGGV